jgi:hypothetical protein
MAKSRRSATILPRSDPESASGGETIPPFTLCKGVLVQAPFGLRGLVERAAKHWQSPRFALIEPNVHKVRRIYVAPMVW